MLKSQIRFLQDELADIGHSAPSSEDGVLGPKTLRVLSQLCAGDPCLTWSTERKAVRALQWICEKNGIDPGPIDGFWGPRTQNAYDRLVYKRRHGELPLPWRPDEISSSQNPNNWPVQREPQLIKFYGEIGTNLVDVELPYSHRIAWDLGKVVNRFLCNVKVKDSLQRVLQDVLETYGIEEIKRLHLDRWGGCFSKRKMRGGTSWSMHSWGIAVDYDPDRNQLTWNRDRAAFARPEYMEWWECWEKEGWVSLGRARNFDFMHCQASRLS